MKCPECDYAYVKNIGKKERYREIGKDESKKLRWDNEKKYLCPKCGWKNGKD